MYCRMYRNEIELEISDVVTKFKAKTSENFHHIDGMSAEEIENIVSDYIQEQINENSLDVKIVSVTIYGSRCKGMENNNSDLDVILEYIGSIREDNLFNILNESKMKIGSIEVDINPITENETGRLDEYLLLADSYMKDYSRY